MNPLPAASRAATGGIVFIIRSLEIGGAERQLVALAQGLSQRGYPVTIITYYDGGALAGGLGDKVERLSLGKRSRHDLLGPLFRLRHAVRQRRPRIIHGYLPDGNILGLLAGSWSRGAAVVWGVRAAAIDRSGYDVLIRGTWWLSCRLARRADLIIANSRAGAAAHIAEGYPAERMRVIPNGIDIDRFRPDPAGRVRLRAEWGVDDTTPVIGIVGRLDPLKDHSTFLRAAASYSRQGGDARFVCVGQGPPEYAAELRQLSGTLGLAGRVIWRESGTEVNAIYSAFDLTVSTSITEGFSNVLGESMACNTTCVATDVGDSAWVIGETGLAVPVRDPDAMASAWVSALARRRSGDLPAPRQRIEQQFGLPQLIDRTEAALSPWLGARRP